MFRWLKRMWDRVVDAHADRHDEPEFLIIGSDLRNIDFDAEDVHAFPTYTRNIDDYNKQP